MHYGLSNGIYVFRLNGKFSLLLLERFILMWCKAWTVTAGSIANGALGFFQFAAKRFRFPNYPFLISSNVFPVLQGTLCEKIRSLWLIVISIVEDGEIFLNLLGFGKKFHFGQGWRWPSGQWPPLLTLLLVTQLLLLCSPPSPLWTATEFGRQEPMGGSYIGSLWSGNAVVLFQSLLWTPLREYCCLQVVLHLPIWIVWEHPIKQLIDNADLQHWQSKPPPGSELFDRELVYLRKWR